MRPPFRCTIVHIAGPLNMFDQTARDIRRRKVKVLDDRVNDVAQIIKGTCRQPAELLAEKSSKRLKEAPPWDSRFRVQVGHRL